MIEDRDDYMKKFHALQEREKEMNEIQFQFATLNAEKDELQKHIERLEARAKVFSKEISNSKAEAQEYREQLEEARIRTAAVDERLEDADLEFQQDLENLRKQVKTYCFNVFACETSK